MTDISNVEPEEPEFYEILTKRLRLRTVRVADTELIMPLITRPEVMYWTVRFMIIIHSQFKLF